MDKPSEKPSDNRAYYEDVEPGQEVEVGRHTPSRDEIITFAQKWDPQPFHLDEEAAKDTLLGGLSASGWHSCAMMMRMMADAYILDSSSQGSPGVEYVRWKRPVRPGDVLRGTARVVSRRLSSKRPTLGILKITTDLPVIPFWYESA